MSDFTDCYKITKFLRQKLEFTIFPFFLPMDSVLFYIVLSGGTLWHLQKFLEYIKYIILQFTPPLLAFVSPRPLIFSFFLNKGKSISGH
jgi:hypothetical protein